MNALFAEPEVSTRTLLFPKGTDQPIMEMGGVTGAIGLKRIEVEDNSPPVNGWFERSTKTIGITRPKNRLEDPCVLYSWVHELGHAVDHFLHPDTYNGQVAMFQWFRRDEYRALLEVVACRVANWIGEYYGISNHLTYHMYTGEKVICTLREFSDAYEDINIKASRDRFNDNHMEEALRRVEAVKAFMRPHLGVADRVACDVRGINLMGGLDINPLVSYTSIKTYANLPS
jgi:hypothetical protein